MYNLPDIINRVIEGDVLKTLKEIPDESCDMVITSPPYYGLRNYGVDGQIGLEETFEEFLKKILEITKEVKRVLKKEGTFFLNFGDCYGGSGMGRNGDGSPGKITSKIQKGNIGSITGKRLINWGGNVEKSTLTNPERQQEMGRSGNQKCMLMQPERLAIKMLDEQGWILRNKIKWAKQVLIKKENRTIGSVMPTSVKDRFNESGEELYFFVKSKKYYFDLDGVRMKNQVLGVTDFRQDDHHLGSGFIRTPELYKNSKYRGKFRGNDNVESFNNPRARTRRKSLDERLDDTKNKDTKSSRSYNMKKLLSEVRMGIKPNTGMVQNKVNDPRGNHEGGPGSWRDFKDNPENSFPKFQEKKVFQIYGDDLKGSRRSRVRDFQDNKEHLFTNINGKNLPTIWLIGSEPHNFQREFNVDTDHFATFPEALCEIPIKAGCPKNGIVLDIFSGSGTALVVAKKLGRQFIGIELNKKYIEISEKRLRATNTPLL
uniref:site-specific DNA-methyltransferase (cytosine-N(4)-specific) n=1 Tax=viral metagenome TaxID=1070528 RepID=A0A6H1ZFH5_9ZZZZ